MISVDNVLSIENARIFFRNFSGEATKFNRAGQRNFCVEISDPDDVRKLSADGWNVKRMDPRDEGEEPTFYIRVSVSYENVPPHVWLITNGRRVHLNADTVGSLDYADIRNVDLEISPYKWEVNGNTGIKAYLKSMYVTQQADRFSEKYADIPY